MRARWCISIPDFLQNRVLLGNTTCGSKIQVFRPPRRRLLLARFSMRARNAVFANTQGWWDQTLSAEIPDVNVSTLFRRKVPFTDDYVSRCLIKQKPDFKFLIGNQNWSADVAVFWWAGLLGEQSQMFGHKVQFPSQPWRGVLLVAMGTEVKVSKGPVEPAGTTSRPF